MPSVSTLGFGEGMLRPLSKPRPLAPVPQQRTDFEDESGGPLPRSADCHETFGTLAARGAGMSSPVAVATPRVLPRSVLASGLVAHRAS